MLRRRIPLVAVLALAVVAAGTGTALAIGTQAGVDITNQATVDFQDANGNNLQALSNVVTTTVSQVAAVLVDPDNTTNGATPGDVLYYAHTVTNQGNGPDTIDVTASSSAGWTVRLFADVNGNGTFDSGTDVLLADTDGDLVPDTGALADDGTFDILVEVTVDPAAPDGASDVTTVTGTSSFDPGASESATDTTNVSAPAITATKSVAPLGDQPPGATLTYSVTIQNNGAADALAVTLTDPVPANTTYVAGSITYDTGGGPAGQTDAADGDEGRYDAGADAVIVDVGTLAAGASVTVTFQVTID
jgi:uncharacterized repeat protein (TIGR01451 family)